MYSILVRPSLWTFDFSAYHLFYHTWYYCLHPRILKIMTAHYITRTFTLDAYGSGTEKQPVAVGTSSSWIDRSVGTLSRFSQNWFRSNGSTWELLRPVLLPRLFWSHFTPLIIMKVLLGSYFLRRAICQGSPWTSKSGLILLSVAASTFNLLRLLFILPLLCRERAMHLKLTFFSLVLPWKDLLCYYAYA